MLNVIKGTKKKPKNKHDLYYQAYCRVLEDYKNNPENIKPIIKKVIVYGIKTVNSYKKPETLTIEEAEYNFKYADIIACLMASLTPKEFVNIFPITKEYHGSRWQSKDYFYTRDYIKGLEQDKPIGEEIMHFLWEYMNWEVTHFNVNLMSYMSDLRRLEGQPSLMEEWADKNGIKTYTMYTDSNGKQYLHDKETGKTTRVRRRMPRYIKTIK